MSSNPNMVQDEKGMYHLRRPVNNNSIAARRAQGLRISMGCDSDSTIVPSAAVPVVASRFIQNNKTVINITQNITQNIKIVKKRR
jgi:hypothetical protein